MSATCRSPVGLSCFHLLLHRPVHRVHEDIVPQAKSGAAHASDALAGAAAGHCGIVGFRQQRHDADLGPQTYPFTHIKFYPMGSLAAIFYVVIVGYSVLQHQLLDIHVTLSRFAAQFVRLSFMVLVGFSLLLLLSRLEPKASRRFRLWPRWEC